MQIYTHRTESRASSIASLYCLPVADPLAPKVEALLLQQARTGGLPIAKLHLTVIAAWVGATSAKKKMSSRLGSRLYRPGYGSSALLPLWDTKDLEKALSRSLDRYLVSTQFVPSPWLNDKKIKHDRHGSYVQVGEENKSKQAHK